MSVVVRCRKNEEEHRSSSPEQHGAPARSQTRARTQTASPLGTKLRRTGIRGSERITLKHPAVRCGTPALLPLAPHDHPAPTSAPPTHTPVTTPVTPMSVPTPKPTPMSILKPTQERRGAFVLVLVSFRLAPPLLRVAFDEFLFLLADAASRRASALQSGTSQLQRPNTSANH
ncbi:hypothetical protein FB451DRAFT_1553842 [Mycena latifolia]|nr:hypothetical protein FB451DRAFT_1553842 [Mycena latifolia]